MHIQSIFKAYSKKAAVYTFLVLWHILVRIFGPRKYKVVALYLLYVGVGICNAICDLVVVICGLVLKICLSFLVMWKNGLIRKIRLISKLMTLQTGYQTIAIHILPKISRSNTPILNWSYGHAWLRKP